MDTDQQSCSMLQTMIAEKHINTKKNNHIDRSVTKMNNSK